MGYHFEIMIISPSPSPLPMFEGESLSQGLANTTAGLKTCLNGISNRFESGLKSDHFQPWSNSSIGIL